MTKGRSGERCKNQVCVVASVIRRESMWSNQNLEILCLSQGHSGDRNQAAIWRGRVSHRELLTDKRTLTSRGKKYGKEYIREGPFQDEDLNFVGKCEPTGWQKKFSG